MFHNYFFLKRLAIALDQKLRGLSLLECFSQNKDELILAFANPSNEFIIRANLDATISLLQFPDQFSRAGKNSVNLFQELIDTEVTGVSEFQFERSFQIEFINGMSLIFKMHGRRSNILLAQNDAILTAFRKNIEQDLNIKPSDLNKSIDLSFENFELHETDPLKLIPALGKEVKVHLEKIGFHELQTKKRWSVLQNVLSALDTNPIFFLEDKISRISIIEKSSEHLDDPITAVNWLYEKTARSVFFEKEKDQLINQFKQKIRKTESYIQKTQQKLNEIEQSRNPEEIANILMANLHQIQTGLSKVVLTDLYNNEPITIKLNTSLSPQKNAENFYRKAKNRHQEIDSLNANIKEKEKLVDKVSRQILELQEVATSKELRKFKKSHQLEKKTTQKPELLPYHEFERDGWVIMVGKNSKSNDELTLKVANKNDLWLHAKDVAGSHVVVRQKPGQNFPNHIIEYAAGLAAANSKRKTDSLCPVIYTQKKYVRKIKGAPAGQVVVDQETVVMVNPGIT